MKKMKKTKKTKLVASQSNEASFEADFDKICKHHSKWKITATAPDLLSKLPFIWLTKQEDKPHSCISCRPLEDDPLHVNTMWRESYQLTKSYQLSRLLI